MTPLLAKIGRYSRIKPEKESLQMTIQTQKSQQIQTNLSNFPNKQQKKESTKSTTKRNKKKSTKKSQPTKETNLHIVNLSRDFESKEETQESPSSEAMEQLRQILSSLGNDLLHLLTILPEDHSIPNINSEFIAQNVMQAKTFLEKPTFVVGFAGGFNAGKSMLINALLGQNILKDGAVPTTSTVTRITASEPDNERITIHFFSPEDFEHLFNKYMDDFSYLYQQTLSSHFHGRDDLTELLDDIKRLREHLEEEDWNDRIRSLDSFYDLIVAYINHQEHLSSKPIVESLTRKNLIYYTTKSENSVAPLVREVQIEINHPMLTEGSQLIDLPGLGSPDPRDEEITVQALRGDDETGKRECDAVVHVMDSLSPFRAGEDRLFQIYRKVWGESFSKRVFLVVSRWGKLERQNAEEMIAVGQTIRQVADRYSVDQEKIFITDGRIGTGYEPMNDDEYHAKKSQESKKLQIIKQELEQTLLPNGQDLFSTTVHAMVDGNVPALRKSLRYYLAFYKEYLHLSDAQRMLESQINKIQQTTSLHLPPLEQIEDDEERFIEECKNDIDRQLKELRNNARSGLQGFVEELLEEEILPNDLSSLQEGLYQAACKRIDAYHPQNMKQQLFTNQLFSQGPLTNPVPWENFRFLLQAEVTILNEELEQFCNVIVERILENYSHFIFDKLGLNDVSLRAFGDTIAKRELEKKFHEQIRSLGHDLELIARNLNRLFFYEYSDVYHSRDQNDALIDIRQELEEQFQDELSGDARRATRWLLRQKMDYHFRKLTTFLPLCFLQELQKIHIDLVDSLEEAIYPIRQAYLERLERREIGQEVDRIRHRYRQIRATLEQVEKIKEKMLLSRQLLQKHKPLIS